MSIVNLCKFNFNGIIALLIILRQYMVSGAFSLHLEYGAVFLFLIKVFSFIVIYNSYSVIISDFETTSGIHAVKSDLNLSLLVYQGECFDEFD